MLAVHVVGASLGKLFEIALFPGPAQLSIACSTEKRFFRSREGRREGGREGGRGEPGNEDSLRLCSSL